MPAPRFCCLLLLLPLACPASPLLRGEGVATTADGTPLYREVHWQRGEADGSQRWVIYQCPDGRPFARKVLPATAQVQARGYELRDARSGQHARVVAGAGQVTVDWREQADAPPRTATLALPADAVIDTGFDAAVRQHWSTLMQGTAVTLPFLVPGRQRFYPVRVQHTGAVTWNGLPAQAIRVRLDTWFGAVAPTLSLVYADADRRLLEFRGTSNLRDAQGRYPPVIVRFARNAGERDSAQWQQELQQPLVSRCTLP
ncbi:hypothetical protein [Stenotrophomonas sp. 24(2023)]|uniref:hypothetical protein n=1 Tax=Stenotrophomonas sp. 24(2023) TaxID=3068324 RepID=UPI0027E0A55C|nr:hypothetical protein [Stenotrophomonas sp. 24(2023)]WMJ69310.1 hypothetical protein Q9R17_19370 [Stenotrophomonas sp. 24(2023)]